MAPGNSRYLTTFLVWMLVAVAALGMGAMQGSASFLVSGCIAVLCAFIKLHEATS